MKAYSYISSKNEENVSDHRYYTEPTNYRVYKKKFTVGKLSLN